MQTRKIIPVLFVLLFGAGLSESCSQSSATHVTFEATSPCNNNVKKMLGISPEIKCEMMKWNLRLSYNSSMVNPDAFNLVVEYGMPKQNTKGFETGSMKIDWKGNCTIKKGIEGNPSATVYVLSVDQPKASLRFVRLDQNLLHLLNEDNSLVNGTGAWSFTLNRIAPADASQKIFSLASLPETMVPGALDTVGIFEGRTPCDDYLRGTAATGTMCQIIKCKLILLRDKQTQLPGDFILYTIYVGNGDNDRHSTTGKWQLLKAVAGDPYAVIYSLEPNAGDLTHAVYLVKGDNNVLFFIDNNGRFMVGDSYTSYTLNRKIRTSQ